ncbi:MAG: class I SAM-dependent methyltransferase [Candidatus Omnitrophica bacterium]|nr:class I SAM-dependent methyltransferase [Candidatus Omnitrophota bacterium]
MGEENRREYRNGIHQCLFTIRRTLDNYKIRRKEFSSPFDALKCSWLLAKFPPQCSDRKIEERWVIERVDKEKINVLDIGANQSPFPKKLTAMGFAVTIIDTRPLQNQDNTITIVCGDVRHTRFENESFDTITAISVLEHIGVAGRYGIHDADPYGDMRALHEMKRILKNGGEIFITVPYGKKNVLPINRCYNKKMTEKLFQNFDIVEQEFKVLGKDLVWHTVEERIAANVNWYFSPWYALAFFRLKKNK